MAVMQPQPGLQPIPVQTPFLMASMMIAAHTLRVRLALLVVMEKELPVFAGM
jgi:hypothetical protein